MKIMSQGSGLVLVMLVAPSPGLPFFSVHVISSLSVEFALTPVSLWLIKSLILQS